ncbi:MAG: TonB-dependent receptor domain-containing protein [bacterium]
MIFHWFRVLSSRITILFATSIFLQLGLVKLQAQNHFAKIIGRVVDKDNQTPLAHVEVYIKSIKHGDVTNKEGRYVIDNLSSGIYDIIFKLQGYKTAHQKGIIVRANETVEVNTEMSSTIIKFEEVLVTANRSINLEHEVSQLVSVVAEKEIKDKNVHQTSEIFKEEVGVFVQKTNQGGGSPIIRGLKANKLLLLVDGIRLNNSTYRGGNLQYLNTVDSESLQRVEVVYGPNSVMYGSDALGGVINVITKKPILHDQHGYKFSGTSSATISTADRTQTSNISLMASNSKWGVLLQASYKSFGNITRGSKADGTLMQRLENDSRTKRVLNKTQSPNDYNTIDFNSKFLFRLSNLQQLTATYQLNRQKSVPRYDVIEAQKDSVWKYAPQERDLIYLKYRNRHSNAIFNTAMVTLSLQRQFERRVRQKFESISEISDQFRTMTTGLQLQFNKYLAQKHQLVYGTEIYYDKVSTKSYQRNTSTEEIIDRNPIFPDGSSFINFGLFTQDEFGLSSKWKLALGARFSVFKLKAPFGDNTAGGLNFGTLVQSTTALTGNLGSMFSITDGMNFVTNIAQGFRTPNLDDVSKLGPGKGSSFFDIPNPNVKPEKIVSFDGGFKFNFSHVKANILGYYNYITDLLLRRPAEFNGLPYVVEESDTLLVFRKENAGKAYTAGFEMNADALITSNIAIFGNLSYTYGQNISENEPLTAMPPMIGMVGVRWKINNFQVELNSRFATEQERLSSEDKKDLRIPEGGTPGWYTLNVRFNASLAHYLSLKFTVSNLLDRNYREHLSGFNAPGRNFILGLYIKY